MIVADSDILILFLRGREPCASVIGQYLKTGNLATTTVNVFEVLSGARKPAERKKIVDLLNALEVFTFTVDAAMLAADLRIKLEAQGKGIGTADYMIAGVCLAAGLPLLTGNRGHFERVPGLALI